MIFREGEWNLRRMDGKQDCDQVSLGVMPTSSLLSFDEILPG